MSQWTCNIGRKGRWLRGVAGTLMVTAGAYLLIKNGSAFWGTGLITIGGFVLFEAIIGWCALRAMGIRLPF